MKKLLYFSTFIFSTAFSSEINQLTAEVLGMSLLYQKMTPAKIVKYQALAGTMHKPRIAIMCEDERLYRDRIHLYEKVRGIHDKIRYELPAYLWMGVFIRRIISMTGKARYEDVVMNDGFRETMFVLADTPIWMVPHPEFGKPSFKMNDHVQVTDKDIKYALIAGAIAGGNANCI